jgi:hypothetical protein
LTASSSSSRVAFFIHSHPWGLISRFPYLRRSTTTPRKEWFFSTSPVRRRSEELLLPNAGVGNCTKNSRNPLRPASRTVNLGSSWPKLSIPKASSHVHRPSKGTAPPTEAGVPATDPLSSYRNHPATIRQRAYLMATLTFWVTPVRPPEQRTAPAYQPTPAQGLPLSPNAGRSAKFYPNRRPVPPGTDPCGPACAPDRFASRTHGRLRLPA